MVFASAVLFLCPHINSVNRGIPVQPLWCFFQVFLLLIWIQEFPRVFRLWASKIIKWTKWSNPFFLSYFFFQKNDKVWNEKISFIRICDDGKQLETGHSDRTHANHLSFYLWQFMLLLQFKHFSLFMLILLLPLLG